MAELAKEGKVKYIRLSEVDSEIIERAQANPPLFTVQSEFSFFEQNIKVRCIGNYAIPWYRPCGLFAS
ncbi:MAG: hypothetical protein EOO86_04680 [Pedobacter sp.]|nr:MAG: hypothetical protein EOO86_04680 [Pedobacter sp.]